MSKVLPYLLLSVFLSAGRNITSKKTAADAKDNSLFFLSQTVLLGCAALLLVIFNLGTAASISTLTVIYGIIYGILLILSQWCFTLALRFGSTSICSVIYSMGFVLPTVSGALFWHENFTLLNLIGLVIVIAVILLSAKKQDSAAKSNAFIPFIIAAMTASGGLGIMQKVQQTSKYAEQQSAFLIISFIFAEAISLVALLIQRTKRKPKFSCITYPAVTGICFGGANLCNTILAGMLSSAVFFPVQNISTILLSTLLGIILFKEKLTAKAVVILLLGITAVIIFSI